MNKPNTQIAILSLSQRLRGALGKLARDRRGATVVEYLVIVGIIAIACIALFQDTFMPAVEGAVEGQSGEIEGLGEN